MLQPNREAFSTMQDAKTHGRAPNGTTNSALRAVLRLKAGLSPLYRLEDLTIGFDNHRRFLTSVMDRTDSHHHEIGTVIGAYGSGKTHFLQVAKGLALSNKFAVAQLNLDTGLGALSRPQQHVFNLICSLVFPEPYSSALEWLADAIDSKEGHFALMKTFEKLEDDCPEVAALALKAIREMPKSAAASFLPDYLSGSLWVNKTAHPGTRSKSYELVRFWSIIARRILNCRGILIVVDELENLFSNVQYTSVVARRAAYRTLSFYTEYLENAGVLCALTPPGWEFLVSEARDPMALFHNTSEIQCESIFKLFERVRKTGPYELQPMDRDAYLTLGQRLSKLHAEAREYSPSSSAEPLASLPAVGTTPRIFCKSVVSKLEARWFNSLES